jgi:hypothetical protein
MVGCLLPRLGILQAYGAESHRWKVTLHDGQAGNGQKLCCPAVTPQCLVQVAHLKSKLFKLHVSYWYASFLHSFSFCILLF